MSYDVVVGELRAAAGRYETMVGPLAGYTFTIANASPESLGHVELAGWVTAVADQCGKAGVALHDGAVGIAGSLDTTAAGYERADQGSATGFQQPLGGLLGSPFGGGTPLGTPSSGPLLGPPAPGAPGLGPVHGPPAPGPVAPGSGS